MAVPVVLVRRQRRLAVAQRAVRPVTIALAVVVLVQFLFWIGDDPVLDTRGEPWVEPAERRSAGAVGILVVALLFMVAASRRNWEAWCRRLDLGRALVAELIAEALAETLNDPSARLLFRCRRRLGRRDGFPCRSGGDRHRTMIDRDQVAIAIEHDPAVLERPAAWKRAAGALALVDHDALEAQTWGPDCTSSASCASILDAEEGLGPSSSETCTMWRSSSWHLPHARRTAGRGSCPELADQILLVHGELVGVIGGLAAVHPRALERSLCTVTSLAPQSVELPSRSPDPIPPLYRGGARGS